MENNEEGSRNSKRDIKRNSKKEVETEQTTTTSSLY